MSKPWTLIVGLDFSDYGKRALRHALAMAHGKDAVLHVVHAVTKDDLGPGPEMEQQASALKELPALIWDAVFAQLNLLELSHDAVPLELHVRLGAPADVIRQVAVDYEGDMVVVGMHGKKGLEKLLLGSVAETLIKDGRVPVLVAHPNRLSELDKTVFPDEAREQEVERGPIPDRHVYRSTLIDAWSAFGRPTSSNL